ncbi:ferric reductase-like transmembrane domain-containing protein [Brumicola nitratireducens]|uniref:Ferric reductase domain-containing protein n=1 Tax=Glaciecola nitratireducens (strain JCM 12485 / KCTC 12276 / FR1064) TaxID=1085623 RepID=G4QMW9_GLANF|nr:ferric reductase-like transmembrane domain-containing protein [Glaciecola nitratireducens]AEP31052.1 ferric reductase domain-containing protein [Glaciecola nitratireducens FR1064]
MTNLRLRLSLLLLLALQLSIWQWGLSYEHFLTLSGFLAINFMSITMILATRPAYLERILGGLDKMYHLHKWTGILAVIFALGHWLIEMADDVLKTLFGKDRSLRESDFTGLLDDMQDMAEDLGEPSLYLLIALVTITLVRWIPYRFWRYLHRVMPLIYIALASHALLLAPMVWWQQATGWLMAVLMMGGIIATVQSLTGQIGRTHRWKGLVQSVKQASKNTIEVFCDMGKCWPGHKAGQFALVSFDSGEGAHPFTLSSADQKNGLLSFQIKALGDYTRTLANDINSGSKVTIEGPYGRFQPENGRAKAQQIWVAGGIGVTPFLAVLENRMYMRKEKYPEVTLHYCTQTVQGDPNVLRLKNLAENLPQITLIVYDNRKGQRLNAEQLQIHSKKADIWFCGPQGLAGALRKALKNHQASVRFHQERFEFR